MEEGERVVSESAIVRLISPGTRAESLRATPGHPARVSCCDRGLVRPGGRATGRLDGEPPQGRVLCHRGSVGGGSTPGLAPIFPGGRTGGRRVTAAVASPWASVRHSMSDGRWTMCE